MQEEVENRAVNLAIATTKLTARSIARGIRWFLVNRHQKKILIIRNRGRNSSGWIGHYDYGD